MQTGDGRRLKAASEVMFDNTNTDNEKSTSESRSSNNYNDNDKKNEELYGCGYMLNTTQYYIKEEMRVQLLVTIYFLIRNCHCASITSSSSSSSRPISSTLFFFILCLDLF